MGGRILIALVGVVLVGLAIVLVIVLRKPAQEQTADTVAELIATDLPEAQKRFLNQRLRVEGTVSSNLVVDGEEGPYHMVDLANKRAIEIKAAFAGKDAAFLLPGNRVIVDGVCHLCEKGVLYLDRCTLVSHTKGPGN
jgi:hypothetical protein